MIVAAWVVRGLLAVLLAFGSEILLWTDPAGRPPVNWLILVIGYLALSALLIDLAARYRVRDVFGLLALTGTYGLANGLLLNPQTALIDMPRTLVTRVMGAHTFMGLLMLILFLMPMRGRRLWAGAAVVGLGWGVWVRWLAAFTDILAADVTLETMLIDGAVGLALIIVLLRLASQSSARLSPADLKLSLVEWLVSAAALVAVLLLHIEFIDTLWLVIMVVLAAFCVLLLWFQKREKGGMLLDNAVPRPPFSLPNSVGLSIVLLGMGTLGYSLPFSAKGEQLALLVGLFTAFGLVWLPTVSLVMGVRAYRKLTRQQRL